MKNCGMLAQFRPRLLIVIPVVHTKLSADVATVLIVTVYKS